MVTRVRPNQSMGRWAYFGRTRSRGLVGGTSGLGAGAFARGSEMVP